VNNAKENLLTMRSDIKYGQIIDEAKKFCEAHDLPEKYFKIIKRCWNCVLVQFLNLKFNYGSWLVLPPLNGAVKVQMY